MRYTELLEILSNRENYRVEFKRDDVRPEQLAKEIVAFANFRGGQVILGVDDETREITGFQRPNCEEWVMDTVFSRYIYPSIIPLYEEITTPNGESVAVITVEQGTLKPYRVRHQGKETVYIRLGSVSREADTDQIVRMKQEAGYYHFEVAPVSGTAIDNIDPELFSYFYEDTFREPLTPTTSSRAEQFELRLSQLDLLVQSSFGYQVCSIAGLILFGKQPGRFLFQHGLRIIHYRGNDISTDAISDQLFQSHLARIRKNGETLRNGLIDHAMQHLAEKLSTEEIASDGITRVRNWRIPERILRELTVNMAIHRDYTRMGRNEIRLFEDRIEFESQGRLPNTLTIEKIKAGQKYPRNPILIQFAQYLGIMEHRGLGIRQIVIGESQRQGLPEPEFIETDDNFTVRIAFRDSAP